MGIMESLGFGHPHYEEAATPAPQLERPEASMDSGEAPAAAVTASESTDSVESAHMDMAGAGPATVDLSNMPVHPAEGGEGEVESGTTGSEVPAENGEMANSHLEDRAEAVETTVPVNAGEFSTAVPPADVNDESRVTPTTEGVADAAEAEKSESGTEDAASDESGDSDPALDQLAAWQKSDAVGRGEVQSGSEPEPVEDTQTPEVAMPPSEDASTEGGPAAPSNSEKKDDLSPEQLHAKAADEAGDIEARFNEMNGGSLESKPEIHAVEGEISVEAPEQTTEVEMHAQESAPATVEDAPFPEPPVEAESELESGGGNETTEVSNGPSVDGSEVHINRAEYLKPEEPESDTASQEEGEATGAEVIDFSEQLDALTRAEEAVRRAKQALIDRQSAA